MIEQEHLDDIKHSGKLSLLFAILKECEAIEDKVYVFKVNPIYWKFGQF